MRVAPPVPIPPLAPGPNQIRPPVGPTGNVYLPARPASIQDCLALQRPAMKPCMNRRPGGVLDQPDGSGRAVRRGANRQGGARSAAPPAGQPGRKRARWTGPEQRIVRRSHRPQRRAGSRLRLRGSGRRPTAQRPACGLLGPRPARPIGVAPPEESPHSRAGLPPSGILAGYHPGRASRGHLRCCARCFPASPRMSLRNTGLRFRRPADRFHYTPYATCHQCEFHTIFS
jgi:hypothetical protein